ncbi:MAG: hypothetical protein EPO13_09935 [Actinomycetota bacterium]|nr:MAG: hypothetical protein EPO13_09935 [Actinomycetota bacterium]
MIWTLREQRRTARLAGLAGGAGLAVAVLAGCGPLQAGSAAIIGDKVVAESTIADQVAEVNTLSGAAPGAANLAATATTVSDAVVLSLLDLAAARRGVVVTQTQVDLQVAQAVAAAGGEQAMNDRLVQTGVPPSLFPSIARGQLQISAIGGQLLPAGTPQEQGAATRVELIALSREVGVEVNPRYGTWDEEALNLGPLSTQLAAPPEAFSPSASPSASPSSS